MLHVAEHANAIADTLGVGVVQSGFEVEFEQVHTVGAAGLRANLARRGQRAEPLIDDDVLTVLRLEEKQKVITLVQDKVWPSGGGQDSIKADGNGLSGIRTFEAAVGVKSRGRRVTR